MRCSIIGSFRKYYSKVVETINIFEKAGIEVLSPKKSEIAHQINKFVILKTDKSNIPVEIQLIALNRILRSNFVYVLNPSGYIGNTTCYELGKIEQKGISIFYLEKPDDLPIMVPPSNIISAEKLADNIRSTGILPKEELSQFSQNILRLNKALLKEPIII